MYMIKCFWFLKSLKQLFIILLISFFGLLGNSFVNAAEWSFYNVDSDYPVWNTSFYFRPISSSTAILEWWWMTDPKAIIYLHNQVNSYRWDSLYFWGTDSTLYSVENPSRSSTDMVSYRANNFCKISWTDFISKGRWNLCADAQIVSSGSVYNDSSLKWEMTQIAFLEYDSFPQSQNYNAICFVYWNLWFSLCYYNSTVSPNYMSVSASIPWASLDPVSFNKDIIWISPWVSWSSSNPWGQVFTPWTWSRLEWRLVINSWYTNSDMIRWYECVGLQPALCYWWFDIDNIFDPSEQYEDFTWYIAGQGATIFEIYNLYSWSFTNLKQFLDTVLTRYQNWQINSFKTEPKALLMLWAQMNTAWFKTSYIASYCNLLLNENNDNIYTWNSVDDLRVRACLRSQEIWDSLSEWVDDIWFQTTTWWIFSWEDVDFDPDTFFSNIMNKIETSLNQDFTSWTAVWLIPWYIIVVLLWIVFIRLITH